ncbi:MAG: nucleotidyltransferase domain-containing protein [Thermodesulfovibrionales bacterium]
MNDLKTYTITEDEKKDIISSVGSFLERDERIIFAYIFGSFVDPEMPFFRDIDIGVYVRDYKERDRETYEIELPLELQRSSEYKYPFDIIVLNRADIFLIKNVIEGELLFTKDEDLWSDFVEKALLRYIDIAPVFYRSFKEAYLENET